MQQQALHRTPEHDVELLARHAGLTDAEDDVVLEAEEKEKRESAFNAITEGQVVRGTVKTLMDFGAFIDLGGVDGLLHITDMSWGRINHPSEMLKIDAEVEVKVLQIDKDKEKIALGLKQKDASPWENIETKYPVGAVHAGEPELMANIHI